jgi:hypothetical protein
MLAGLARRLLMVNSLEKSRSLSPTQTPRQPLDKKHPLAFPQSHVQPGKRFKKRKYTPPEPGSSEDVISRQVVALLGEQVVASAEADGTDWASPFGFREQVELTVSSISSSGMCPYSHARVSCRIPPTPGLFTRSASMVANANPPEQVKGSPFPLHRNAHGSLSFRSPCPGRS